jgi:hypothetical protein
MDVQADLGRLAAAANEAATLEAFDREVLAVIAPRVGFDVAMFKRRSGLGPYAPGLDAKVRVPAPLARLRPGAARRRGGRSHAGWSRGRPRRARPAPDGAAVLLPAPDAPARGTSTAMLYLTHRRRPIGALALGRTRGSFGPSELEYPRAVLPTLAVCEAGMAASAALPAIDPGMASAAAALTPREREVLGYVRFGYTLRAALARKPSFAALVQAEPSEPVRGIVAARYFMRRAVGPGWALCGDAGLHKEYVSGDGMSEALLSARRLAAAIAEGTDAALERFWHQRDVHALPRFCFYKDQGASGPRPAFEAFALARLARDPQLLRCLAATFEHRVSPYDVAGPAHALRWALAALLRGRFALLRDFAAMGRRTAEVQRLVAEAELRAQAAMGMEAAKAP